MLYHSESTSCGESQSINAPCTKQVLQFDLLAYARQHRYRTRNLHDGYPVPPTRRKRGNEPLSGGYTGSEDRWDVVVGLRGYLYVEECGLFGIYLAYKSGKGVRRALEGITALDGQINQIGDFEVSAILSLDKLDDALKLIKVSKRPPGNPNPRTQHLNRPKPERETGRKCNGRGAN